MKALTIAWKDTLARFRDLNGLLLMLVAPLVVAAIMGAAFSRFNSSNPTPVQAVPLVVVNADEGRLGGYLVEMLHTGTLADLLAPVSAPTLAEGRANLEQGQAEAVVYLPPEFTQRLEQAMAQGKDAPAATVQIYADPAAGNAALVQSIVTQIAATFGAIAQKVGTQALAPQQATTLLTDALAAYRDAGFRPAVALQPAVVDAAGGARNPNPLAYFAPSMAILFLLFSTFESTQSILREERDGTLARLLLTPTGFNQILLGKLGGAILTGVLQLGVLMLASWLFFGLPWGTSPLGIFVMTLAVVAAAVSLGALVTALARDISQAGMISAGVALIGAALGGNFVLIQAYPYWLQLVSKLTINRWAIEGFTDLTQRGLGATDIVVEAGVLVAMAACFFALALWRLPARFVR